MFRPPLPPGCPYSPTPLETPREGIADADRVFTDMTELPRLIEEVLAADAAAE